MSKVASSRPRFRAHIAVVLVLLALLTARRALAFPHVVRPGETLAQIALRVYGDAKRESLIAMANHLDVEGGVAIVPGMRIDLPAPGYHRVTSGETWGDLALIYLGDSKRADVLARANSLSAWQPPADGLEIVIPYVLAVVAKEGDRMETYATRFLADRNAGWQIDAYNNRKSGKLGRGELLLIPIVDLELTEAGKAEARTGTEGDHNQGAAHTFEAQRKAAADVPRLLADVRGGRYVDAVARGNRILGAGALAKPQMAIVHRALLEAYIALESPGAAAGACAALRKADPKAAFDPVMVSPKIRAACPAH